MQRAAWAVIAILLVSILLVSCGGGSPTTPPTTSGILKRAFISNQLTGAIDIVNVAIDALATHRIIGDPAPTIMVLSPDKTKTLVFSSSTNRIDVISNKDEAQAGSLQLFDRSESFFYQPDNKTVYVAVRNVGQVVKWDTSAGTTLGVSVPNVRWIVRSNNGNIILAFPDDSSNEVYFIDTTATTPTAVKLSTIAGAPTFDRPVWAVFSSDDTKAYIMNCGPECGSTSPNASVQVINIPAMTSAGASAAVPGATHGLLNANTLYVAGTPPARACVGNTNEVNGCGTLSKIDVASGLGTPAAPIEINNGYHDHMLLGPNNKLFVGAEFTCTVTLPNGNGCLSIVNVSANTATITPPCGTSCGGLNDVTGMTAIANRPVVYVVEGGEVHIYNTTTDTQQLNPIVDTIGRSWDVVSPD